ncbi:hypothetical protein ARSEF4850_005784 [Beauveria asiatica]
MLGPRRDLFLASAASDGCQYLQPAPTLPICAAIASAHHLHAPPTCPSSSGKISDTDLSHHLRPRFTGKQRVRRKQLGDAPDPVHRPPIRSSCRGRAPSTDSTCTDSAVSLACRLPHGDVPVRNSSSFAAPDSSCRGAVEAIVGALAAVVNSRRRTSYIDDAIDAANAYEQISNCVNHGA